MFEKLRKIIQLKSIMGILFLCFPLMNLKGGTPMKKVSFEPQAWNELEFDWNEYVWSEVGNPCSPYFFGRGIIMEDEYGFNEHSRKNSREQKRRHKNSCSGLRVFLYYGFQIL